MASDGSQTRPVAPGYWMNAPKTSTGAGVSSRCARSTTGAGAPAAADPAAGSTTGAGAPAGAAGDPAKSVSTTSIPRAAARCASRALVCGSASASTRKTFDVDLEARRATSIPSTTAVDSSSIDAFAVARPVRSVTIVWKLMSASRRPCEISGWYGV